MKGDSKFAQNVESFQKQAVRVCLMYHVMWEFMLSNVQKI